jgi:hypothetical protein
MPYGRCVIYMSPGDPKEIIGKARTGLLPMSAWRSESDAKAADELARQWVAENVDLTVVESFLGDYEWLEFAEQ